MANHSLFWLVVAVFVGGQVLLVHAAWRLRRSTETLPPGMPRSHGGADLAWTVATAALTGVLLYGAYLALP
jgi:heme/copper-type cytochrome/quinol oxidase subunit 2